jgi:hypothetical protein
MGCGKDVVQSFVGVLLAGFTPKRGNFDDAAVVMKAYVAALWDVPAWALQEVCGSWVRRAKTAPSPADLRDACLKVSMAARDEANSIKRILGAKPFHPASDEERASVGRKLSALAQDMRARQRVDLYGTVPAWKGEFRKLIAAGKEDQASALMRSNMPAVEASPRLREMVASEQRQGLES